MIRTAIALLVLAQAAWSLDPAKTLTQYAHRIWGQEEGLSQPTIYSILQTRNGFLWLGTQDGLLRFDGLNFREYTWNGETVLHGSLVRSLLEDRAGNLWVGSIGSGLARIAPGGEFTRFGTGHGLQGVVVTNLSADRDGAIWVSTEQGLGHIENGHVQMFTSSNGLPADGVRATCEGSDGTQWVAGRNSLLGKWNRSLFVPVLHDQVSSLACTGDGAVWAGTDNGVVRIGQGQQRRFTTKDGLPDNMVSSLTTGPGGEIWIGTNDGITRYNREGFSSYRTRDGLSHSVALCLAFDREGSLWAGTKNGLDQLADSAVTPFSTNERLSSNQTSAVITDLQGQLWIGTLDKGLNVFDGRRFTTVTHRDGLSADRVLALAVDHAGNVWAGTANGVTRLRSGKVIATYPLSGPEVRAIFVDDTGVVWAGTNRSLERFEGGRFHQENLPAASSGVVALSGGKNVRLFVSTDDSQLHYLQDGKFSAYSLPSGTRPVVTYDIDHVRHLSWMGTLGSSLIRWRNGKTSRIRVRDGLYDNRIYSILTDDHGNLWMASSKGIFRVGEQELNDFADGRITSISSIPFSTGQLRFECRSGVQPAACRTRDGRLWFSTTTGLVVIDPNHLNSDPVPPPVRITALLVDGQRASIHDGVQIRPQEKNIEIRYAGLSFVSPEKVTFEYILDGFNRQWTEAGARREAFFTNLPPGEFHFKVRARSAAGVWSTQAASIDFAVQPRLYQRWWFFPALCLLLAGGIVAGYRARVRRLRMQFALVTAERTRIARELHDTLLQGLSGVTMQLHALWLGMPPGSKEKRVLGEIIQDAGQYSAEARQSLWGLRSKDSESPLFSDRLADLARSAVAQSGIELVLDIQPLSIEDRPEAEFQLLRVAKEAISNAVRHAQAHTLRVSLQLVDGELQMSFEDDGKGFDDEQSYDAIGHFGLTGMKERVAEIGAVLDIESSPRGTLICARLPLGRNAAAVYARQRV